MTFCPAPRPGGGADGTANRPDPFAWWRRAGAAGAGVGATVAVTTASTTTASPMGMAATRCHPGRARRFRIGISTRW